MPRAKPSTSPEEHIIGYFVTKDLDRVQEMLSHINTIVRSRTRHLTPLPSETAKAPVRKKAKPEVKVQPSETREFATT